MSENFKQIYSLNIPFLIELDYGNQRKAYVSRHNFLQLFWRWTPNYDYLWTIYGHLILPDIFADPKLT